MREHLGEERWAAFNAGLDDVLREARAEAQTLLQTAVGSAEASLDARGTFLEVRQCTVNVCVIGRTPSLSKAERAAFEAADREAGLRVRVLDELVRRVQYSPLLRPPGSRHVVRSEAQCRLHATRSKTHSSGWPEG